MAPNPQSFLEHLRAEGYHPRSNKHSDALALAVVGDLVNHCAPIAEAAEAGRLVYDLNKTILSGTAEWNVDLVLGQPKMGHVSDAAGEIARTPPSTVQIAIEIKSVMTEHRKAIKNRKRDFEAHHDHVHRYSNLAIAGGILVINSSPTFKSPLRSDTTIHKKPKRLVEHCVDEMRAVTSRSRPGEFGLDAKCVVVVDLDTADPVSGSFQTKSPAPPVGDPLHYDAFIQRICESYRSRFA